MSEGFDLKGRRVWVAGHRGMVGSAIVRRLEREDCEVISVGRDRADLRRQEDVESWMADTKPEVVFVAAATVGGILANSSFPANFLYDNLMIEANIINSAWKIGVAKLVFLGSSCIYPKFAEIPIKEDALLTGALEPTNQWYAVAKIAGIKLCQAYRRQHGCDFVSAMPTNLYGPLDNYDLQTSHVLPALIAKIHTAKQQGIDSVTIWGTGEPRREFLHTDDLADGLIHIARHYSGEEHVNIGSGTDVRISEAAQIIADVVGWKGQFIFDTSKPDGTLRKVMDVSKLANLGWTSRIGLRDGIADAYSWYLKHVVSGDLREVRYIT